MKLPRATLPLLQCEGRQRPENSHAIRQPRADDLSGLLLATFQHALMSSQWPKFTEYDRLQ
ncbi:hypothetical protein [Adhaeretor mobilis]|uniref:hypothetical protein n=1 Tax=Adhaeretor mobilis TaxID=1930276 RepID=UPI0011A922C1|nr:hypothetical protein [Adhaeretor mobilis]